jgi:outer membrane receptor for ferrienterochelin and colicins
MIRTPSLPFIACTALCFTAVNAAYAEGKGGDSDEREASGESDAPDDEIVVTGSRTETSRKDSVVSTQVIGRTDIENSGASTVADLLDAQPGVTLDRSFAGTSVRLQGLSPEHTLVLVDGQRVIGRKNGAIDMSRYPVEWIERIEIVKGPSSVLYGSDALGGVINIITRRADGPFSADSYASYGTLDEIDASASTAIERGAVSSRVHAGYHSTNGYDRDAETLTTNGPSRETIHAGSISTVSINPDWRVTPRISYRQQDSRGVSESGGGAVFDVRNLSEEVQVALGSDASFGSTDRLQVTAFSTWYRDQYRSDQRDSDALDAYEDTSELLFQGAVQYDRTIGTSHRTTLGVDALTEEMTSGRLGPGEGDRQRIGLFAQDEWSITESPRVTLLPGVRFDLDSQFGNHTTPRVAGRYDPTESIAIRAGFGWGYRAPSFKELLLRFENPGAGYTVEGNQNLRPETSRNANLAFEWTATDTLWLSVSGYRNDVKDLIGFGTLEDGVAGSPTRFGYINVSEALTQGGEFNAELTANFGFSIGGGYALTDTRDLTNDRPLEGRSKHRVTGSLNQTIERTGTLFTAQGSWSGTKFYFIDTDGDGEENRLESDPTTLIDLRIFQDIQTARTGIRLFAGTDNLLNAGDAEYQPIAPRTFYAGFTGRYATN